MFDLEREAEKKGGISGWLAGRVDGGGNTVDCVQYSSLVHAIVHFDTDGTAEAS
jgi:hypothetical protein